MAGGRIRSRGSCMIKMKFKIKGVAEMRKRLHELATVFPERVEKALVAEAKIEMAESQRRVPINTGALKKSGHVGQPVRSGRNISVPMIYDEPYAVYVHENPDAIHPKGQWKYLE